MASAGTVKIIGNKKKKKHEKNLSDNRDSITVVRVGSAGNVDGPRIYLAKGKQCELGIFKDFCSNFRAPPGSCAEMTPNAYMTNEAWSNIVPKMCAGIREMEVIRDHPDKWVVLSLDGFGSHLDPDSLIVFTQHKILVLKEEGDTSQVSQAYDQMVAKEDKRFTSELLENVKMNMKTVVCQWRLICVVNSGLNEVEKGDAWRNSFIRVNACPTMRIPFKVWIKKIEQSVNAADRFFTNRTSLFDAMPAVWLHLLEGERRSLCALFDKFEGVWSRAHLLQVMALGFVKLDDVEKLRGCYLTSKEDSSVFVDPAPFVPEPKKKKKSRQWMLDMDYTGFSFAPKDLLEAFLEDRLVHPDKGDRSRAIQGRLFCHMSNFVASNHGWHKGGSLIPSPYLHCEMSNDQIDLLNPTARDIQLGAILDQCTGRKATKVIAKRRIDMVTGNVNSYARILNGPGQLEKIKTYNELAASIAALQREKDEQKAATKANKKQADVDAAVKKSLKIQEAKEEHERILPNCLEHLGKGIEHVLSLRLDPFKRDILKHVFQSKEVNSKLRVARANELLIGYYEGWSVGNAASMLDNSNGEQCQIPPTIDPGQVMAELLTATLDKDEVNNNGEVGDADYNEEEGHAV